MTETAEHVTVAAARRRMRELGPLYRGAGGDRLILRASSVDREVVCVGWDGRSQAILRYRSEMHLPDHQRSIVTLEDRP